MTQTDELNDVDGGDGAGRDGTPWRWLAAAMLLAGLAAVVVFGLRRSQADRAAEQAQAERLRAERGRVVSGGAWGGDVNYMLFCAAAEGRPGGLDIRAALDQIALRQFPATMSFSVVVSVTPDRAGRRYEIVRLDPDGKVEFAQELKVADATDHASVNGVKIQDLQLAAPREVVVRVFRDGEVIAERALPVSEATAAAGAPGGPASSPAPAPEGPPPAEQFDPL